MFLVSTYCSWDIYWSKLPMQHRFRCTFFIFYIYPNIFIFLHFLTIVKIWLHWQKLVLATHRRARAFSVTWCEIRGCANGLIEAGVLLRRVSRSWHCSISSISKLWKKYQQTSKMMIVNLIHLQHYLNKRSPVCN